MSFTADDLQRMLERNPQLSRLDENVAPATAVTQTAVSAPQARTPRPRSPSKPSFRAIQGKRPEKFRSKTERRAWEQWRAWVEDIVDEGSVARFEYEMLAFKNLPGKSSGYTADLYIVDTSGRMYVVEVKGSSAWKKSHGSGRSSSNVYKAVADTFYWMAEFYYLWPEKGGWKVERVEPGMESGNFRMRVKKGLGS